MPVRPPWRTVAASVARAVTAVAVLLLLYAVLPTAAVPVAVAVVLLAAGLALFGMLVTWQLVAIERARHPALRAGEALAVAVTLFLLLFAATYFRWSEIDPASFSEQLSRTDALYFTVTTFATVGFGDIAAVTPGARAVVTGQVVANLLVLGLIVNAMVSVARRARRRRDSCIATPEL